MKKSDENKTENCTILNGVVLTQKAVGFIESLQASNNNYLNEVVQELTATISVLIDVMDDVDEESEVREKIKYLNTFTKALKALAKP